MVATPTFSVATTGAVWGPSPGLPGSAAATPGNVILPDTTVDSLVPTTQGGMHNCMRQGEPFLAKGPDGALHWYRLVPGKSLSAYPIIEFMGP